MATTPRKITDKSVKLGSKKAKPKTAAERMAARRARLRAQGLKPVTYWLPDMNNPKVRAQIRKEAALLAKHPENAEIDAWVEAVYDLDA